MSKLSKLETKDFALTLLRCDSEEEVESALIEAGYWYRDECWRFLGDDENNFKTVGSQAASPTAALVEKIVNSIDARLLGECLRQGIDPTSDQAPQTIRDAVSKFFSENISPELTKSISLAVTGARARQVGMPSITISDLGEGQTPSLTHETFLSINQRNKLRIPFVQGKFNMGGTGALMFCGKRKLQLLITRRDPTILAASDTLTEKDGDWCVTIIRRETPPKGYGAVRNPFFRYLAPINCESTPNVGQLLTFSADSLPLMPDGREPYVREVGWGSCIKLYEYDMRGYKGHILRTDGLLSKLEILLPDIALPIRLHECRKGFQGKAGSFDTSLIGLKRRVESGKGDNLEPGFPASVSMSVQGELFTGRIYAFKDDTADRYRGNEGIVFTINGQTHGAIPKTFFERKNVKMSRIARSLLIVMDATDISVGARADLFKNSRDRLSNAALRQEIENELETQISEHQGLRELRERRRREEVSERLKESKPLEDVLRKVFKSSPTLSKLFLTGQRLSSPFKVEDTGTSGGGGQSDIKGTYQGKAHPTYFRFDKLESGEILHRTYELGTKCRVRFETDVENRYFHRSENRGRYQVYVESGSLKGMELTSSINLYNGYANWNITIPNEHLKKDEVFHLKFIVEDDVLLEPFVNEAKVSVTQTTRMATKSGNRREAGSGELSGHGSGSGRGKKGKSDHGEQSGIQLPQVHKVTKEGWKEKGFNEFSACTVIEEPSEDGADDVLEFYINVDNKYLLLDIKDGKADPAVVEAKFIYANVLIGLALIHDGKIGNNETDGVDDEPASRNIERTTKALSPFLIPMVEYLGGVEEENVLEFASIGDEV